MHWPACTGSRIPASRLSTHRSENVRSPNIGRILAITAIAAFFAWTAVRSIGARPAAEPRYPFPKPAVDAPLSASKSQQTAVLAGGCFWGVQAVFEHLKGVRSVTAGYSGGRVNSPSYEMVSSGLTGHAESVSIKVYPRKIVTELVPFKAFFRAEDYHQDYLQTHTDQPYIVYNDLPKLEHLKKQFPELCRK